jgi:hypothetical protein
VQHTTIPEPPGFAQLSKAEQVRYLQGLWDRIAERHSAPVQVALVLSACLQLCEQGLGVAQILGVESFGEKAIDLGEYRERLIALSFFYQ